jgi:ribosome maturation factor RimP
MITAHKITDLVENHLSGSEFFLVDVIVRSGNRISVFLDGDHGVNIEICKDVNRFLNEHLDRDTEDYDLTVSSAGADKPLLTPRQYRKNLGKALDITTRAGEKFSGIVAVVNEEGIEVKIPPVKKQRTVTEEKTVPVKFTDIKTAHEVITFKP